MARTVVNCILDMWSRVHFRLDQPQFLFLLKRERGEVQFLQNIVVRGFPAALKFHKLLSLLPQLPKSSCHSYPVGEQLASFQNRCWYVTAFPPSANKKIL